MSRETRLDSGASVRDVWFWALKLQFQIFCTGLEDGPRAETRSDYHMYMHLCVHAHICTSARVYVCKILLRSGLVFRVSGSKSPHLDSLSCARQKSLHPYSEAAPRHAKALSYGEL